MATRDETRRELRELAKLAEVIPKERSTIAPPALEPSAAANAPLLPFAPSSYRLGPSLPPPLPPPLSPSDSIAPAATTTPPGPLRSGGRWGWALAAGSTLIAAMVGGLLLGQALASHPSAHAAAAGTGASEAAVLVPTQTAKAVAAPPPAAPEPAPSAPATTAETAAPIVVTDEGASAVTVRSPKPAHHGLKKHPARETADEAARKAAAGAPSTTN